MNPEPLSKAYSTISYKVLNAKQKEIYNYQKAAGVLGKLGFQSILLTNDWNGADFLAVHMVDGKTLKVQLKGRFTLDKKYFQKDIWMMWPFREHWYVVPHDVLLDIVSNTSPRFLESASWTEKGNWTAQKPNRSVLESLNEWKLS